LLPSGFKFVFALFIFLKASRTVRVSANLLFVDYDYFEIF